jgi:hypothetical protein
MNEVQKYFTTPIRVAAIIEHVIQSYKLELLVATPGSHQSCRIELIGSIKSERGAERGL